MQLYTEQGRICKNMINYNRWRGLYMLDLDLEYQSVCPFVRIGTPPLPQASVFPPNAHLHSTPSLISNYAYFHSPPFPMILIFILRLPLRRNTFIPRPFLLRLCFISRILLIRLFSLCKYTLYTVGAKIMTHFAEKYCSVDSKFLRTQRS